MLRETSFEVLNAKSSLVLNFRIVVLKTFTNELQDQVSIVFLNFRSKFF